jgi:uncharacterized protein (TIGR04255 family)
LKLLKAPILEAYIRFDFILGETAQPLDPNCASKFFDLFQDHVKPKDVQFQDAVQIKWDKVGSPKHLELHRTLEKARACNANETRWIQIGQRHLAFNYLRNQSEQDYPGYPVLKSTALEGFAKYVNFFSPQSCNEASLHYINVIEIPKKPGTKIEEFLALCPHVPNQNFGPVKLFMVALSMVASDPNDALQANLTREPDDNERNVFRLRLEWDAKIQNIGTLDATELSGRLDRVHEQVLTCFKSCFTDTGWQMFEPRAEDSPGAAG